MKFNKESRLSKKTALSIFLIFPAIAAVIVVWELFLYFAGIFDEVHETVIAAVSSLALIGAALLGSLFVLRRMDFRLFETRNALKHSYEMLNQITDNVPGVVYRYRRTADGTQKFEFMNRNALTVLGYPSDEILKNFNLVWDQVPPEDLPGLIQSIEASFRTLTPWAYDFRMKHPDGKIVWLRGRSIPEKPLPDGSVIWNGIMVNIDEEKRIHRALDSARDYLLQIINSVADPIFVKNRDHKWVLLNDAMCKLFGRSRADLIGKSDYDFFPKTEADVFWQKDEEVFRSASENLNEEYFTDSSGLRHTIVTKKTLYTDIQGAQFIVGVIRDITDLKAAEENLKRTVDMVNARNQELKDFASVVSHDLKAPTYAVAALAQWFETDHGHQLDPNGKEQISLIRRKIQEMRSLIDGILSYSMLDQHQETVSRVDTEAVIDDVIRLIHVPPHIRMELSGPFPVWFCDKTRVHQIFQNLIENAVKYMDKPQGVIHAEVKDYQNEWEIRVTDNGPGIPERNREKIFQLFQAFGGKSRHESTGVGLAIVRKIVDFYGGRVWVESEIGRGSSFAVRLPKQAMLESGRLKP